MTDTGMEVNLTAPAPFRIGVDLGGTKIETVLLSKSGKTLFRDRASTPRDEQDNYQAVLGKIKALVEQALSIVPSLDDYTIGVGIPGTLDRKTGIVQNANTTWLSDRPFRGDLERIFNKKVFMDNDANCFTLAEATHGAAKGFPMVFGIIMGTGCGGGLCINGAIHRGAHGIAGEFGHFAVDPGGEVCFCGNIGCIDTKLTGPALSRAYKRLTKGVLSAEEIVKKVGQNDLDCQMVFDQFLDDFGRSVGGLISLLDPDAVVLGGGLSNIPDLYTRGVERVREYAFHKCIRTPILKNLLGDSAGVFGAAWLPCHTPTGIPDQYKR